MNRLKQEFLDTLASYQGILHKVTLVYFKTKAEQEDMFQEILYQLWKSYPKLQKRESIGSWIYKVAINTSLSKINNNKKLEFRENAPELSAPGSVEENFIKNEESQLLINAIYRLNNIDKTIMLLYLEEKSYDEIAEITGLSASNVGVKINRSKKELNHQLTKMYHEKK